MMMVMDGISSDGAFHTKCTLPTGTATETEDGLEVVVVMVRIKEPAEL